MVLTSKSYMVTVCCAKYTTTNSVEDGGFAEAVYKFIEF